jgi:DNA adenine methylase
VSALKPILKWAGGKRQLLPELRRYYPATFRTYFEPFVGSAAVFFDLHNRGVLAGHDVRLADSSADLIGCYTSVRDRVEEVIACLERLAREHEREGEACYYSVRDERFNPMRRVAGPAYGAELAAMLIYLNRTGYNGLFRLNASGEFNVPAGRYRRPRICDAANLRAVAGALGSRRVELRHAPFVETLAEPQADDFVYLDPPYAPLTRTARFTSYTAAGFDVGLQELLREKVVELAAKGVHVVLSNSAAEEVRRLYAEDRVARSAGLKSHLVPARRAINSRATRRGPVLEYVITNVQC